MSKKKTIREVKASYGVDAEVADATGTQATEPGGHAQPGDKSGNPEQGKSVKPSKVDMISAMVERFGKMTESDLQAAYDATLDDKDDEGKSKDAKNDLMKKEASDDNADSKDDEDDDDFDFNFDEEDEKSDDAKDDEKKDDEKKDEVKEGEQPPWLKKDGEKSDDKEDDKKEKVDEADEKDNEKKDDEKKDADDKKDASESFRISRKSLNITEDTNAIFKGANLTEDFKKKATELIESIVVAKVNGQLKGMQKLVESRVKTQATAKLRKLAERLDTYLNYVVEQWMKDNAVAIESGLQREIVEDFLGGLKALFTEHHISIPDAEESIVEKLTKRCAELESALNEEVKKNAETKALTEKQERSAIIKDSVTGLTEVQAAKIGQIAEALTWTTADDFKTKVKDLRESYYPADKKPGPQTLEEGQEIVVGDEETKPAGSMGAYLKQIENDAKK